MNQNQPSILILKKVERSSDQSIRLELVVDSRLVMRSKLEGVISDPSLAAKFQFIPANVNQTSANNENYNANNSGGSSTTHTLCADNMDVFLFIKVWMSLFVSAF